MGQGAEGQQMRESTGDQGIVGTSAGDVVDLMDLSLSELASSEDTVLDAAARRKLAELEDPREVVAGWSKRAAMTFGVAVRLG